MSEHRETKIRDIVILFNRMNTSMLVGQMKSITTSNTQVKILAQEDTERMRLGLLTLECIGDLPEALLYELGFNTLLMDYAIYEVPTHYDDALKEEYYADRD